MDDVASPKSPASTRIHSLNLRRPTRQILTLLKDNLQKQNRKIHTMVIYSLNTYLPWTLAHIQSLPDSDKVKPKITIYRSLTWCVMWCNEQSKSKCLRATSSYAFMQGFDTVIVLRGNFMSLKTQCQDEVRILSGRAQKFKVAKQCWKQLNEHNMMYIYHKQCENMQKNQ